MTCTNGRGLTTSAGRCLVALLTATSVSWLRPNTYFSAHPNVRRLMVSISRGDASRTWSWQPIGVGRITRHAVSLIGTDVSVASELSNAWNDQGKRGSGSWIA